MSQQAQNSWAEENSCRFISLEMLNAVNPDESATNASIVGVLNKYARQYNVNTPERLAHFLSQIAHESNFQPTEENLGYRPKRMREIFGCRGGPKNYDAATDDCTNGRLREKLWTEENTYARNPENLGSYVYANRLGNGDEASGEGYKYRGRGLIQLTGKNNYEAFQEHYNQMNPDDIQSFVDNPELLVESERYSIAAAFHYWSSNELNGKSDSGSVCSVTRGVNGGSNGFADRQDRFNDVACLLGIAEDNGSC